MTPRLTAAIAELLDDPATLALALRLDSVLVEWSEKPCFPKFCPVCNTVFVPVGKQLYCSDRCNNRISNRRHKARKRSASQTETG